MNNSKQVLRFSRLLYRNYSQGTEVVAPRFDRVKQIQKKFQVEDGTPVYIKGGVGDKLIYGTTVLLTTVGIGMALEVFYKITFK